MKFGPPFANASGKGGLVDASLHAVRRRRSLGHALEFFLEVLDDEVGEGLEDGPGLVEVVVDCPRR